MFRAPVLLGWHLAESHPSGFVAEVGTGYWPESNALKKGSTVSQKANHSSHGPDVGKV